MFFGTAQADNVKVGGVDLTLVLGKRYQPSKQLFLDLLNKQLASYQRIFGGNPLSSRYLIIVNNGLDDGGAFASSFSQFIDGDADEANRIGWGVVMAHELLHFWNGLSLVRADSREEWFNEGFTDYLTTMTLAQNGIDDEQMLFRRLENIARRYWLARVLQRLKMSVRDSGENKQPNRQLVYGGGAITGLALDVEMRKATNNKVGVEDLMRSMYAEFGKPGLKHSLPDIERHVKMLTGKDFHEFFAKAVDSASYFDSRPYFAELGLDMDIYLLDEAYVRHDPKATAEQNARYQAIFGKR